MELKRRPFQGVLNIIRFNRHFYLVAVFVLILFVCFNQYVPVPIRFFADWLSYLAILTITLSLLVSCYIYDLSDLYKLTWLPGLNNRKTLTVNAGFDETSVIIKHKFPNIELIGCDFYNSEKHTEISIKRARKAYPPPAGTIQVSTDKLPFQNKTFDYALAILSAHEIRAEKERIQFFGELHRILKPDGQILVTEHLRNASNFVAYTIGFFHFYSQSDWVKTFEKANLRVMSTTNSTPFITTFILEKDGNTF